jgi:long-subunit acyl-CoA synthetase (AMP-forming)
MYPVSEGRITFSSGTTNTSKKIWHSKDKLNLTSEIYKKTHNLDATSSILNFLPLTHIGGLALDLAGRYVGAKVTNIKFNPFNFLNELETYSHTMLPDSSITVLRKTKGFNDYDFSGKFIHCGTEPHNVENILSLVERGAKVFCNWGMTEIGPICVHTTFEPYETQKVKEYFWPGYLLGDNFEIEWKIEDGELVVRSETSIYRDWFYTGDIVKYENGTLYYIKRR